MKDNLNKYNEKRDFTKTKEPKGLKVKSQKKLHFAVQHHLARKDHYDFRLEWNGVLKSWAVPKGPSYNIRDKRLAIKVEDHPFSYRKFEGTIPKGEYGGGTVMLWDEGYYELDENYSDFNKGPLKFILHGKRLIGKWTLIHFKSDNWLLIKEKDKEKGFNDISKLNTSIKTLRTMEEITQDKKSNSTKNINYKLEITNPDKVIIDRPKITKQDIFNYYEKVLERMFPYLEGRLISTIRCPNGKNGECFFKKHFEGNNKGLGKKIISNDNNKKEDYYFIKDKFGIINEVQMNGYEFHMWASRAKSINKPDIMVFDLDPDKNLDLKKIRQGVKDLKSILDELNLVSFLKTSGGKGYHVLIPFKSKMNWEKFSTIAKNIALLMEEKWPEKYTSNMRKEKRKGKIFIDWVRNTKSSTSVAPYSLRIRKKATVSMPIKWSELDSVKPNEITMEKALIRLKRKDPWEDFFNIDQ